MKRPLFTVGVAMACSCVGTTGSDLVTFEVLAAGPADATRTGTLEFTSGRGYHVVLTRATLHVGGVYLNRSLPISGSQETSCVLPALYVAQETASLDVDTLSPVLQRFALPGQGTADKALAGEVWLTSGDVAAVDDTTIIADIAGSADLEGEMFPFRGTVTIGKNRASVVKDPSQPGQNPICKQRIVSPIPITITPKTGGTLTLRIDPRPWFANVDFSSLASVSADPPMYEFADQNKEQPNISLYAGIHATTGVYSFEWQDPR